MDTTSVNVTGNTIFDTGTSVTLFPATVVKAIGDMVREITNGYFV